MCGAVRRGVAWRRLNGFPPLLAASYDLNYFQSMLILAGYRAVGSQVVHGEART